MFIYVDPLLYGEEDFIAARRELLDAEHTFVHSPVYADLAFTPRNFTDWEAAVKHVNNLTAAGRKV